jgi:hypothetical protein
MSDFMRPLPTIVESVKIETPRRQRRMNLYKSRQLCASDPAAARFGSLGLAAGVQDVHGAVHHLAQIGRALVIAGVASMAIACFEAESFIANVERLKIEHRSDSSSALPHCSR